jgi:signal transduction histidine kinase
MLRRKFLCNLAPLVCMLLLMAVCAILVLQSTMRVVHQFQTQTASIDEVSALIVRLRWLILGLVIAFLLEINVSVLVMLRMAAMILRPVDKLLEATKELGNDHFHYRVRLPEDDEFAQLADAYNSLAAQLESNEQRKVETMHQVAAALNHELNNAVTTVDLQLRLLRRRIDHKEDLERCLQQISTGLGRMTRTVQSLKNVRRIVLTDYPGGTKMLDIERSSRLDLDDTTVLRGSRPLP